MLQLLEKRCATLRAGVVAPLVVEAATGRSRCAGLCCCLHLPIRVAAAAHRLAVWNFHGGGKWKGGGVGALIAVLKVACLLALDYVTK